MAKYKAYPEYKDSAVEWLGKIPCHWKTISISRLFSRTKRSGYTEKELLSVYRDYGVIPKSSRDDNNNKPSEDLSPYQLVQPNDLVMNKMKAWQGSIAISEYEGIVSPAYFVYQPNKILFELAHPKYVHYLLRNPIYVTQYLSRSKGIRVNQWDLDPDEFRNIELLLPDKIEQEKIYSFLDHETAKIDNLIEKQQQLIELLKEKRQAVISHAVTKGLNPDVPMKDSGIEWLGEVPEHWDVSYLKYVIANEKNAMVDGPFGSSVNTETDYVEQGIPVIRTVNITNLGFSSENLKFMRYEKYIQLKRHSVRPNDVLFSKVGTIGNACILPDSIPEAILSTTGSCKITLEQGSVIPEYLVYVIQSMNEQLMQIANSNVQPFLNMSNIRGLNIPLPKLDEQKDILQAININLLKIDDLIDKASKFELLLQERRTALISAAVTGKIDVRDWVAPDTQNVEEPQEATA